MEVVYRDTRSKALCRLQCLPINSAITFVSVTGLGTQNGSHESVKIVGVFSKALVLAILCSASEMPSVQANDR